MKKGIVMATMFAAATFASCAEATLIASPKVLIIPIVENHDPIVDLKNQSVIAYGPSPEIPNNTDYTKIRKTVYEKLEKAQAALPKGLHFCLYEGYRSLALQKMLFEHRFQKVQALHSEWTSDQIFDETMKLVSPVTNKNGSPNIPPHSTGGAIDVYLMDDDHHFVDMGIHPKDWMEDIDGAISETHSQKISPEAQKYRQIMSKVLEDVGFINYSTEYWHWSYGDRYWAYKSHEPAAIYGSIR